MKRTVSGAYLKKAVKRYVVRNMVDAASFRDISEASAIEGYALPKLYHKMYFSISAAIHSHYVRVRSRTNRRKRAPPQRWASTTSWLLPGSSPCGVGSFRRRSPSCAPTVGRRSEATADGFVFSFSSRMHLPLAVSEAGKSVISVGHIL